MFKVYGTQMTQIIRIFADFFYLRKSAFYLRHLRAKYHNSLKLCPTITPTTQDSVITSITR